VPARLSSLVSGLAAQPAPADWAPERCVDLLTHLAVVPDPRDRRGRQHRLTTLLAIGVCAVLSGARSLSAIGEWAADAPAGVLAALGVRADPLTGRPRPPDEATVRRLLARIDADALDTAVGSWLLGLRPPASAPVVEPPTPRAPWRAVAVDGKSLRGARTSTGRVHLLAVMDHDSQAVLNQVACVPQLRVDMVRESGA
jgi:hypothetical protein